MGNMAEDPAGPLASSAYTFCLSSPAKPKKDTCTRPQRAAITPIVGDTLNLSVREVSVPSPALTEALVKIFYTGLCRSDACFSIGPEPGYPKHDHIAGHEGIGKVVKSHDSSLLGRTVGIRYLGSTCGSCIYCLGGLPTSCPAQLNAPKQVAGTFQEYATVPISCLVPLPDRILDEAPDPASLCAALCSGSTALTALRAANIGAGSVLVVIGVCGAIGHLTGVIARRVFGAKAIGIDLGWKCDMLRDKGYEQYADILLDAPSDPTGQAWSDFVAALVQACTQLRRDKATPRAAEAAIVCASSKSAFQNLEEYVCDGGRIVCVGVPRGLLLSISIHALVERNLHLTGNLMGDHRASLEVMRYISTGLVQPLVTEVTLDDIPEQMQNLVDCKTVGKIVARIGGDSYAATSPVQGCLECD